MGGKPPNGDLEGESHPTPPVVNQRKCGFDTILDLWYTLGNMKGGIKMPQRKIRPGGPNLTQSEKDRRKYYRKKVSKIMGRRATDIDVRVYLANMLTGIHRDGRGDAPQTHHQLKALDLLLTHFPESDEVQNCPKCAAKAAIIDAVGGSEDENKAVEDYKTTECTCGVIQ